MNTSFERVKEGTNVWFTPPELISALGEFNLDPCSSKGRPWPTAKYHYTENGLKEPWFGRVWCNSLYGNQTEKWLKKCSQHKNVTALIYARTETKYFFDFVWDKAVGALFIKGRLKFYDINGKLAQHSAGAPSVLVAWDYHNALTLMLSRIQGKYLWINKKE